MKAEVARNTTRGYWYVTYFNDEKYIVDITYHDTEEAAIRSAQKFVRDRK